ncbi:hypothetical protein AAIB78_000193 [Morganella morganii]
MSDCNAPVRARLVTKPYRRILKTLGYAGGYLLILLLCSAENNLQSAAISSLSTISYYLLFILEKPVVIL